MTDDGVEQLIRRAIGGDVDAVDRLVTDAATTPDPLVIAMAALLDDDAGRLGRARTVAVTRRDRQLVEITRAHLAGERDAVDALARDHLVDFPESYVVAWIASGAPRPQA